MIISFFSIIVSIIVFYVVRLGIYRLVPTNPYFAELAVLIISTFIISLIFVFRQFRQIPGKKLSNPYFHKAFLRTFLTNFVILFLIFMLRF